MSESNAELVESLRYWQSDGHPHGLLHAEAADAITLLLAENAKIREALESCRRYITQYGTSQSVRALAAEVDAALTEEQHD